MRNRAPILRRFGHRGLPFGPVASQVCLNCRVRQSPPRRQVQRQAASSMVGAGPGTARTTAPSPTRFDGHRQDYGAGHSRDGDGRQDDRGHHRHRPARPGGARRSWAQHPPLPDRPRRSCRAQTVVMDVMQTIRYQGGSARLSMLVQMLEQEGVAVEWSRPYEERGLSADLNEVIVNPVSTGSAVAIAAAVKNFRNRVPRAKVDVASCCRDTDNLNWLFERYERLPL